MACSLCYGDTPLNAVQLFTYLRHRYPELPAYFRRDRDVVIIPEGEGTEETLDAIREIALHSGLCCSEVSAAWPEYLSPEIAAAESAANFLVITEIRGKYSQPQ